MFASVAQPPEIEQARDRKDRRVEFVVLSLGLLLVIAATVGAAVGLRIVFVAANSFLT
jgi:hypothetical protein